MRLPCEIFVKKFLPFLRANISHLLLTKYNWTQIEVANALKITQTSVSKYRKLIEKGKSDFSKDRIRKMAEILSESIAEKRISDRDFIRFVCNECYFMRIGGEMCKIHKLLLPSLDEGICRACLLEEKEQEILESRFAVLENMHIALRMLQECEKFVQLIPEVRSNLVMASENATSINDIAGVPGRITEYKGRAYPVGNPEYGASKHTASILLAVLNHFKDRRSILCIRYNEKIRRIMEELSFQIIFIKREKALRDEEFIEILNEKISTWKVSPDALVDLGGVGVEAITYLVGKDAIDVVKKALLIVEKIE